MLAFYRLNTGGRAGRRFAYAGDLELMSKRWNGFVFFYAADAARVDLYAVVLAVRCYKLFAFAPLVTEHRYYYLFLYRAAEGTARPLQARLRTRRLADDFFIAPAMAQCRDFFAVRCFTVLAIIGLHTGSDTAGCFRLSAAFKVPAMAECRQHFFVLVAATAADVSYLAVLYAGCCFYTLFYPVVAERRNFVIFLDFAAYLADNFLDADFVALSRARFRDYFPAMAERRKNFFVLVAAD